MTECRRLELTSWSSNLAYLGIALTIWVLIAILVVIEAAYIRRSRS